MEQSWQIMLVVFLLAICSLLSVGNTRSLASLKHKIMKRSLYEETCPPPYIIEVTERCNDSCWGDDYCVGNKMCCYDGCSYVCMDPVPSEPVVDWNENDSIPEEFKKEELEVVTPVVEELGCFYHDMLLTNGEKKPLGCKECTCFNGNLMCDVSKCNKDYQARLSFRGSGSGDDNDDDEDDGDNDIRGKGSGNSFFPLIDGVEEKEDFIPFKELDYEDLEVLDSKGRFTTLGPEINDGGGDTSGGEGVKQKPEFISIEELENEEVKNWDRKGLEQFQGPEISGGESSGGKGVSLFQASLPFRGSGSDDDNDGDDDDDNNDIRGKGSGNSFFPVVDGVEQKEDFIPVREHEYEGTKAFDSKGRFTTLGPEISGGGVDTSGGEDVKQKPGFISIEEYENQQTEDWERKGLEQFLGPEINGGELSGGKGVKQKEDFIPIEEFKNEEAEAFDSKGRVMTFGPEISGGESSGEEDEVSGSERDNFIPFDEERTTEQSGDNEV